MQKREKEREREKRKCKKTKKRRRERKKDKNTELVTLSQRTELKEVVHGGRYTYTIRIKEQLVGMPGNEFKKLGKKPDLHTKKMRDIS